MKDLNAACNAPANMSQLRDQLCVIFARVQKDSSFVTMAKEASNAAGKIIKTVGVQLDYQHHVGKKLPIAFME